MFHSIIKVPRVEAGWTNLSSEQQRPKSALPQKKVSYIYREREETTILWMKFISKLTETRSCYAVDQSIEALTLYCYSATFVISQRQAKRICSDARSLPLRQQWNFFGAAAFRCKWRCRLFYYMVINSRLLNKMGSLLARFNRIINKSCCQWRNSWRNQQSSIVVESNYIAAFNHLLFKKIFLILNDL